MSEDIKLVIAIRRDLKLRRGKEIVQGCHFIQNFIRNRYCGIDTDGGMLFKLSVLDENWLFGIQKKICVAINSIEELHALHNLALESKIESYLIQDNGLTELKYPEYTAVIIGPDYSDKIDNITKSLKLY